MQKRAGLATRLQTPGAPLALLACTGLLFSLAGCASLPPQKQFAEKFEKTVTTRYLVYLPDGYRNSQANWPLVIFLHGSGERGDDLERVKVNGLPKWIEAGKAFGFIAVSPQCPEGRWWDLDLLMDLLSKVERDYRVDRDRICLTGLSSGGFATWQWAETYPELFAAIAPVCGGGNSLEAYRLKTVPVWAFHGAKDPVVPVAKSQEMVAAVQSCGGDARITVYPGVGHNSWEPAYADDALYTWLLAQKRKPIEIPAVKNYAPLVAVHAPANMKLAGQSSEWSQAPALRLDSSDRALLMRRIKLKWRSEKNAAYLYRGPKDCSAEIKMMWDEKGLYVAAEVTDDNVVCNKTGDQIWIGDCVDLGLSFRGEKDVTRPYIPPQDPNEPGQEYFTDKDFIFGFAPTGPNHTPEYHVYRNPLKANQKADNSIQVISQMTPSGYRLKVFISAKYLGCEDKMKSGGRFRFNCGVYDLDDARLKAEDFSLSEYPGAAGNPWSPDTFGQLVLQ